MKKSALIAAIALIGLNVAGGEAQASTKKCPKDALCLWAKENYTGKKTVIKETGITNVGKAMNNRASSVKSRYSNQGGGDKVLLYDKRNATGQSLCLGVGLPTKYPQLGPPNDFDNKTTSVLLTKKDEDGPVCV